jgi:crotonobetainyl-CoA:carnitine CoA-transferase CaiB-like acyl-CoA transferase
MMSGPLAGLQVLDLSWGIAGPMTGMVLADHGAEVTRITRPGGGPFDELPGTRVWNRGKRTVPLDLAGRAGRAELLRLAAGGDVLLESFAPGVTARLGIDAATLLGVNPALVYCSITAYGTGNEHSGRPGYEPLVAARTGRQWAQRGGILSMGDVQLPDVPIPDGAEQAARADGPIFSASPWMSMNAFYHASIGIAAALVAREHTGRGQHVEATMLDRAGTGSSSTLGGPPSWMTMKGAPKGLFECKDGVWVHQWPLKPLTVIEAAACDSLADALAPDFSHRRADPHRIGMEPSSIIEIFHWFPYMQEAFAKFPAADWVEWGARVKEGVQIARSPEECLRDPLLLADGCVAEVIDPELGLLRELGLLIDFSATPGAVRQPVQAARIPTAPAHPAARPAVTDRAAMPAAAPAHPLSGLVVLDLGLALAGPFGTSVLADLGADVIKVNAPWDVPWLQTAIGQMANRGKRSICLNLRDHAAIQALYRMVAQADVVTHNMRPGVAERVGIGYEDLLPHNPRMIYVESRGFDAVRSAQHLPGTDQVAAALSGQEWEDGGCGRGGRPFFGTSMGDIGNGYLVALGTIHALYHRERTGHGQKVATSILNACMAVAASTYVRADGSGPGRPRLDAQQLGFSARCRLYETADGWLCLAALTGQHMAALARAVGRPLPDEDDALAGCLKAAFSGRTAKEWIEILDEHGVPAEVSARRFDNPHDGQPTLTFSATPARVVGLPPEVGAHTREVLAQFGFTGEEIATLAACTTVGASR